MSKVHLFKQTLKEWASGQISVPTCQRLFQLRAAAACTRSCSSRPRWSARSGSFPWSAARSRRTKTLLRQRPSDRDGRRRRCSRRRLPTTKPLSWEAISQIWKKHRKHLNRKSQLTNTVGITLWNRFGTQRNWFQLQIYNNKRMN